MPYDLRQTRARTRGRSGTEVSGQYRVTVPDPDALDRLRTQNRVYDRTLTPRDQFTGSIPVRVCSLPGSSRESSTEPMDMDEGTKTTCKIVESVRVARGWVHSDSEGYLPDTNSPLLTARCRREGPGSRATRGEMSGGDPRRGQDVTESPTLLQIPLCMTAGPSDEEDPNLHWPALVDPVHDLDQREAPKGRLPERSYEEQPPTDTLIPPAQPAWEEPKGAYGKKSMKGPSLSKKNGSSPGAFLSERSQAEARQSAVEVVRRITSSCSSLESSSKSERGGMDGGDWDPTYDGFTLDGRGPRARMSPPEGHET